MNNKRRKRWYEDGLRFQCTGCGDCCTGEPGYVYVNDEEIAALAQRCGLSREDFERQFVRPAGERKSLIEMPNGDCIFFDRITKQCRVYDVRPLQCRTWPFWGSNTANESAWEETCRVCPGCGQGTWFSADQIDQLVKMIDI